MKFLLLVLIEALDLQSINGLMGPWSEFVVDPAAPSRYQQYYTGPSAADRIAANQNSLPSESSSDTTPTAESASAAISSIFSAEVNINTAATTPVEFALAPTAVAAVYGRVFPTEQWTSGKNLFAIVQKKLDTVDKVRKLPTKNAAPSDVVVRNADPTTVEGQKVSRNKRASDDEIQKYFNEDECPGKSTAIESDMIKFYNGHHSDDIVLVTIVGCLSTDLSNECRVDIVGAQYFSDKVRKCFEHDMEEINMRAKSFLLRKGKEEEFEIAFPILRKSKCDNEKMEPMMIAIHNCTDYGEFRVEKFLIEDYHIRRQTMTSSKITLNNAAYGVGYQSSVVDESVLFPLVHSVFGKAIVSKNDYATYESYFPFEAMTPTSCGCKIEKLDQDGDNNEAGIKWSGESADDDLNAKLDFSDDDSILDVGLSAGSSNAKTSRRNTSKLKLDDSLEKPAIPVEDPDRMLKTLQSILEAKQHQPDEDEDSLCGKAVTAFLRRLPKEKKASFRYELEGLKLKYSAT